MPFCSAVSITGINFSTSGTNLTLAFTTETAYADEIIIEATNITFRNYSRDDKLEVLTFTITEQSASYTGEDVPYYSFSSNQEKTIKSGLNSLNVSALINITNCELIGTITTSNGQRYSIPSCAGVTNLLLTKLRTESGNNIITLHYDVPQVDICKGFHDSGVSFGEMIVLIIVVSIAGIVLFFLFADNTEGMDLNSLAIIIIIAIVVFALGMKIIGSIGNGC